MLTTSIVTSSALVHRPLDAFLPNKLTTSRKILESHEQKRNKIGASKIFGKDALIFYTYSGPHTGIYEAISVGNYIGQFFEHIGFTFLNECTFSANFMVQYNAAQNA